jgi:hypothetical protein
MLFLISLGILFNFSQTLNTEKIFSVLARQPVSLHSRGRATWATLLLSASPDVLILSCAAVGPAVAVVFLLSLPWLEFLLLLPTPLLLKPLLQRMILTFLASLLLLGIPTIAGVPNVAGVPAVINIPFANGVSRESGVPTAVSVP